MADYVLDTVWRVAAEPEAVWPALTAVEEWPTWWRGVLAVERLKEGDPSGHFLTFKRKPLPARGRCQVPALGGCGPTAMRPASIIAGRCAPRSPG